MAWRERRKQTGDSGGFDLRLRADDRIGGPPKGRTGGGSRARGSATPARKNRKAKQGLRIGRLFYWSVVLALWVAIAGVGALIWIGIHLPPIQSLEIPKRPLLALFAPQDGEAKTAAE